GRRRCLRQRAAPCWAVQPCPCSDRNQERTDMFFISKKLPRQHGLHEPFRHENHPRPVTRRQLMGAGFLAGPAYVLGPAWLGALLKSQGVNAATQPTLAQDISDLATKECDLQNSSNTAAMGTNGPVPLFVIDLAGGANLM